MQKKEKWIIAIANSEADDVRILCVEGTAEQVKDVLMELVEEDRSEDQESFSHGTYDKDSISCSENEMNASDCSHRQACGVLIAKCSL